MYSVEITKEEEKKLIIHAQVPEKMTRGEKYTIPLKFEVK